MGFGDLIQSVDGIVEWISNTVETISGIFSDVDFTILYNWLPSDIATVISAVIAVLIILALFGLLRRILFFLG